jgi:prepilin peptidase CpaA
MKTAFPLLHFVPLFALLLVAAGTDLRARRIPNWLTLCIAISGLFQSFLPHHAVSPTHSIAGLAVGFALPLVLFILNAIGGGDVKLLAAVGAWIGPLNILLVFVLKDLIGLGIVLVQAGCQGRLKALFSNSAVMMLNLVHIRDVGLETVQRTGLSCRSVDKPLPMAVPIMAAVLLVQFLRPGGL